MRACVCVQKSAKWLYIYGLMVIAVVIISITRALAFFETTFRCCTFCTLCSCLDQDWGVGARAPGVRGLKVIVLQVAIGRSCCHVCTENPACQMSRVLRRSAGCCVA